MKKVFSNKYLAVFDDGEWLYVINRYDYILKEEIIGTAFYLGENRGKIAKGSGVEEELRKQFPKL